MPHDKLRIYQKTLGLIAAIFFAYCTISIGDEAIASTYTGVGLLLKLEVLVTIAATIFGLWLLFSKKEVKLATIIGYAIIFLAGLIIFFSAAT